MLKWNDFWQRSRLVVHDPTGQMLKYQAAFDLYRYYLVCCAGERRETPPRFQIDLYRYHLRQHGWLTGIICAVEQYQSFVEQWEQVLASVPEVPLGTFRYQAADVKPEILPGDQLVPAADMTGCEGYKSGDKSQYEWNRQHTELFAIWPANLFLQNSAQRDCALRSYQPRSVEPLSCRDLALGGGNDY